MSFASVREEASCVCNRKDGHRDGGDSRPLEACWLPHLHYLRKFQANLPRWKSLRNDPRGCLYTHTHTQEHTHSHACVHAHTQVLAHPGWDIDRQKEEKGKKERNTRRTPPLFLSW